MGEQRWKVGVVTGFVDAEDHSLDMLGEAAAPGGRGFASFTLDGEESFRIPRDDRRYPVWSGLLREWPDSGLPIYVEAEDDSHVVGKLIPPDLKRIVSVDSEPREGRLKVVPHATPIFYYLGVEHPRYEELRAALVRAAESAEPTLVFIDPDSPLNDDRILDVRLAEGWDALVGGDAGGGEEGGEGEGEGEDGGDFPNGITNRALGGVAAGGVGVLLDVTAPPPQLRPFIMADEAQDLFVELRDNHGIPFCYIRDCCKARGHKMCDIIRRAGVAVTKVWNYGSGTLGTTDEEVWTATLSVETPQGALKWKFHTAPLVDVEQPGGEVVPMVLDPATLSSPAPVEEWRALQGDPGSRIRERHARFYWFSPHGVPGSMDAGLEITEERLRAHRGKCV